MKKNITVKVITTLAIVVLMLCAVPLFGECGIGVKAQALSATGQCGENVYWNFDSSTGELRISGTGSMYDYSWIFNTSPFAYQSSIKSVVFDDGVTSAGMYSFSNNYTLKSVTFGNGLKHVGDYSFQDTGITEVTFPDSVIYVGDNSFSGCSSLTKVTVGKGVKKIAFNAFGMCNYITSLSIPENVTEIDAIFSSGANSLSYVIIHNPDCIIKDVYSVFPEKTVIHGYDGSTAASYAKKYSRTFVRLQSHVHSYTSKTIKASTTQDGKIESSCDGCGDVLSTQNIPKISTIKLSATNYTYDASVKTPTVTVKDSSGKKLTKDTDYTVKYASGRKAVGTYKVKVTFKGNYTGSKTLSFNIELGKVTGLKATFNKGVRITWNKVKGATGYELYEYNKNNGTNYLLTSTTKNTVSNSSINSRITVKVRAYYEKNGTIYYGAYSDAVTAEYHTHSYKYKTTKATLSSNGKEIEYCSCGYEVTSATIYKIKSVSLSKTSFVYDGNTKTPSVTVKDSKGNKLVKDVDYTVKYASGRKAVGRYNVKISFKGNYSGSKTLKFDIVIGQVTGIKTSKNGKGVDVTWNKVKGATGYILEEYDAKKGKYVKKFDCSNNSLSKPTFNGVTITVRIRAYYVRDGKTYYGAYSSAKKITV